MKKLTISDLCLIHLIIFFLSFFHCITVIKSTWIWDNWFASTIPFQFYVMPPLHFSILPFIKCNSAQVHSFSSLMCNNNPQCNFIQWQTERNMHLLLRKPMLYIVIKVLEESVQSQLSPKLWLKSLRQVHIAECATHSVPLPE